MITVKATRPIVNMRTPVLTTLSSSKVFMASPWDRKFQTRPDQAVFSVWHRFVELVASLEKVVHEDPDAETIAGIHAP